MNKTRIKEIASVINDRKDIDTNYKLQIMKKMIESDDTPITKTLGIHKFLVDYVVLGDKKFSIEKFKKDLDIIVGEYINE